MLLNVTMNFCLPSVDGYLLQQQQTLEHPSEQSVPSGARNTSPETAAAVGGPSATLTLPPANSLKSLLHQIAGVVAAAQKIPGGDDYTIRTSTSSGARRATEAAAADTLRILLEIAAGCSGRTESLIPLRKAEALHRSLAHTGPSTTAHNGTGSSSSSALLEQDGQQIHEGVGTVVQGLLDELLEAVDVSLEAHRRNPQKKVCTRLSQEQQEEKSNAQKKGQKEQHQDADIAAAGGTATLHRSKRVLPLPGLLSVVEGRPQSHWAYLINNNSRRFVPRLHQKPHKKYPLPEATIEAQKHRAIRLERRRELFEDAVSTGLALETAVGHQRQLLLQQLQQQEEDIQKLQHEEDEAQKAESPEPLPHPYEGELNELEWLLPGDKQQPDIYSGVSASSNCWGRSRSSCQSSCCCGSCCCIWGILFSGGDDAGMCWGSVESKSCCFAFTLLLLLLFHNRFLYLERASNASAGRTDTACLSGDTAATPGDAGRVVQW